MTLQFELFRQSDIQRAVITTRTNEAFIIYQNCSINIVILLVGILMVTTF